MHPAQIKAALVMGGYKQIDLANELGLSPNTVSAVVKGRSRSKQVEERIAAITGHSLAELWPQWYGEGELILTTQERHLVVDFRALSPAQRDELIAMLHALKHGMRIGGSVVGTGRSVVAGRDFNVGAGRSRKKS